MNQLVWEKIDESEKGELPPKKNLNRCVRLQEVKIEF